MNFIKKIVELSTFGCGVLDHGLDNDSGIAYDYQVLDSEFNCLVQTLPESQCLSSVIGLYAQSDSKMRCYVLSGIFNDAPSSSLAWISLRGPIKEEDRRFYITFPPCKFIFAFSDLPAFLDWNTSLFSL
jgi:hypothetical protein